MVDDDGECPRPTVDFEKHGYCYDIGFSFWLIQEYKSADLDEEFKSKSDEW